MKIVGFYDFFFLVVPTLTPRDPGYPIGPCGPAGPCQGKKNKNENIYTTLHVTK